MLAAVVFDQLIGLHHVAADLAAPGNLALGRFVAILSGFTLGRLELVQA